MSLQYKTKGNSAPGGKPKVYFACHGDDHSKYFDKICKDIWETHDAVIYYSEERSEEFYTDLLRIDLMRMSLFVVPVTYKLLHEQNNAMDVDIAFALSEHIPVLPFMMEPGLDALYSSPDRFGELQYISPYSDDASEISYAEKLKKYLEAVLVSDATARRVRAAFDAYIFLSYRKKDRKYANELMRIIHAREEFRDIAIWYDEFLTPGESFKENIDKMLRDSKLFTLLVTPNILEEHNFVMDNEYPEAKKSGMPILPAEMEKTDRASLGEKFDGIPECADPYDDAAFYELLLESLSGIAKRENDTDPEHNYLIGLAYLEGIDVEIDRERGISLIESAAEAGLDQAIKKLYDMYSDGIYVKTDSKKALMWIERLVALRCAKHGKEHPDTLTALFELAYTYRALGEYKKGVETDESVYETRRRVLGEEHPDTLSSLNNLATSYYFAGEYQKSVESCERVYKIRVRTLGDEHTSTLTSGLNLSVAYNCIGEHQKAIGLCERIYKIRERTLGAEHSDTLTSGGNLAVQYEAVGEYQKARELLERVYDGFYRTRGEEHPDTITALGNLASACGRCGDEERATELAKKAYDISRRVCGEEHPATLIRLDNLSLRYFAAGELEAAAEISERAYDGFCRALGKEHPDTVVALENVVYAYRKLGDHARLLEPQRRLYETRLRTLGEAHGKTVDVLFDLAFCYFKIKEYASSVEHYDRLYTLLAGLYGEEHKDTVLAKKNMDAVRGYIK